MKNGTSNKMLTNNDNNNLLDDFQNLTKTIEEYKTIITGQNKNDLAGKLNNSLEQVSRDMADILSDLKQHLSNSIPAAVKENLSTEKIVIQNKKFFTSDKPKSKNSGNNNNHQVKTSCENGNRNNQQPKKVNNQKDQSSIKAEKSAKKNIPIINLACVETLDSAERNPKQKMKVEKKNSKRCNELGKYFPKIENVPRQYLGISRKMYVNKTVVKQPQDVNLKKMQGEDKSHILSPPPTPLTAVTAKNRKVASEKHSSNKQLHPETPRVRNSKLGRAIVNKCVYKTFSGCLSSNKRPNSHLGIESINRSSSNTSSNRQFGSGFNFNQRYHSDLTGNHLKKYLRNSANNLSQSHLPYKFKQLRKSTSMETDPFSQLKRELDRAIIDKKTFTLRGQYSCIRQALLKRGWVEKYHIKNRDANIKKYQIYSINDLVHFLRIKDIAPTCKKVLMSKLLDDHQVDLYWSFNYDGFKETCDKKKFTLLSKFRKDVFNYTSKQGLVDIADNAYWFHIPGVSQINHPRSYKLCIKKNTDMKYFIKDFHITAAMSLMKWVVKTNSTRDVKLISPSGKIPIQAFEFAANECYKFIKQQQHFDIDENIQEASPEEWDTFLDYFYHLVHIGNHFKKDGKVTPSTLVKKAGSILNCLKTFWPYLEMDGHLNIWIMKPNLGCCGYGIHICRTLQYVVKTVKQHANVKYVIQKYIERPLLIHNTKFDIRQWFLISSANPLTIWMYKVCYLRFSSQTYNLRKLHNAIHLTNNAVQSKYKSAGSDLSLPSHNMWTLSEFQNYLANIGYPDVWKQIIYPGMKQGITAAVLIHQDKIDKRPNCFELYGADFMLTEDFTPWLIEINSSPALYASTPVTAKLCPVVLEDVIKVVIDNTKNPKMSTGNFELIYKEKVPVNNCKANAQLKVEGVPLTKSFFKKNPLENGTKKPVFLPYDVEKYTKVQNQLQNLGDEVKTTLENLLQVIQTEKNKGQDLTSNLLDSKTSIDNIFAAESRKNLSNKSLDCQHKSTTVTASFAAVNNDTQSKCTETEELYQLLENNKLPASFITDFLKLILPG